ncbi:MAG: alpha/beta hydrolase [Alcaligenaceae bacterium]|nr:alpha/beta hydrolase [Alcaligenaceae bacterium SAGV5]MPS50488.1 alpha/beta hydrolase [Alcaligenaceae bacterium SAGV3]MPT59795.1 alpha/beta hydrolase [Alcaligenaceae bacterium]
MKAVFLDLHGLRTRYLIAGGGPLLMLIHPVGYPAEIFARNIDELARDYTVVAPDLPGQGHSAAPAGWTDAPQVLMADQVLALAAHLGFDRLAVMGSSLGGLVAARAALQAPRRVTALVLTGTGSVFNEPAGQPEVLKTVYANGSRAYAEPSLPSLRARIANTCFRPPAADDILLAHMTAYALPGAAEAYRDIMARLVRSMGEGEALAFPHLEDIEARTLVIAGRDDTRTSLAAHREGAARMRDAAVLCFDECGHLPFLEHPRRFNEAVSRFLAESAAGERVRGR